LIKLPIILNDYNNIVASQNLLNRIPRLRLDINFADL